MENNESNYNLDQQQTMSSVDSANITRTPEGTTERLVYPSSLTEIMRMVANGETPPDVKVYEERVSSDASIYVKQSVHSATGNNALIANNSKRPLKPWERIRNAYS